MRAQLGWSPCPAPASWSSSPARGRSCRRSSTQARTRTTRRWSWGCCPTPRARAGWPGPVRPASRHARSRWLRTPTGRPGTWPCVTRWSPSSPTGSISAGFMRILGPAVLSAFPLRVVNTHPALLPSFPGAHAVRDALGARRARDRVDHPSRRRGRRHRPDRRPARRPGRATTTTRQSLHERIKVVERELLVDVVRRLATHNVHVTGRKVTFT